MKKNLVLFILSLLSLLFLTQFAQLQGVHAQSSVKVKAGVGKFYFTASGIVSPYASVVMTTQSTFMASTVADREGKFSTDSVLVNEGFKNFCLEAIDVRRIGTSYTCFETEPAESDFSKPDIFLPPTVGLSARKLVPGSTILASGYSMPLASVDVNLGKGIVLNTKADINGYYKAEISDLATGKYSLFATAQYKGQESEEPDRKFEIESLPFLARIPGWFWISLLILIVLIIIILIIILWKRRKKKKQPPKQKKVNRLRRFFSWRA